MTKLLKCIDIKNMNTENFEKLDNGILFDKENHIFYNADMKKMATVSEIAGVMDKSNFLVPWAVKSMAEYLHLNWDLYEKDELIEKAKREYRSISKQATDIGSAIHQWIEDFLTGKNPDIPTEENINRGIQAFLKWKLENKFEHVASEMRVYSLKHKFAGILDCLAKVNGKLTLIDFKSSKVLSKENHMQTAGYKIGVEEMTPMKIKQRMVIRLGKLDGSFEVQISNDKNDEKAFLSALNLINWKKSTNIK